MNEYIITTAHIAAYGWSASVPNLSGKLRRNSLRYTEVVELADALGYELVWQKRGGV